MGSKLIRFIFWFSALLFFASIVANNSLALLDPDLGWHLKVGQDILATGRMPSDQIYMHTLPGTTWVDHEWLTNLSMYLLFKQFNYLGLILAYLIIIIAALWLSIADGIKLHQGRADAMLFLWAFLGLLGILGHVGPRPQMISFFLFAFLMLWLKKWQKTRQASLLYILPPFFWLWACLHAGFLIGLAVLAIYLFFDALWPFAGKQSWQSIRMPIIIGFASFFATWLTPNGYKLYSFLTTYSNSAYLNIISEWRSLFIPPIQYWQVLFLGLVCGLLIASFLIPEERHKLKKSDAAILLLFLFMTIRSVRHFPLFYIAASFIVLPLFLKTQIVAGRRVIFYWFTLLPVSFFLMITIIICTRIELIRDPFSYFCQNYPCTAVSYIHEHPRLLGLKWLNNYNIGGYLIWTLPEAKLYIDGRMPQTPYQGSTLLEHYMALYNSPEILAKLDAEKIDLIFWQKPKNKKSNMFLDKLIVYASLEAPEQKSFTKLISNSPKWQLIFEDDTSLIWQRR